MALTDEEVADLVATIDEAMATLQAEYGRRNVVDARIKFPRGYFLKAENYRKALPNIGTERQRRNASYSMMHIDLLRWMVIRTDISGSVLSLIVKDAISVRGEIIEWMLKQVTTGKKKSYRERTKNLVDDGTISQDLKDELDWVWDNRNNSHLSRISSLEHDRYTRKDYNRALTAHKDLCDILIGVYGRAV